MLPVLHFHTFLPVHVHLHRSITTAFVTVVKRNGQLVKLEFCQSVVRLFVYHSSRRRDKVGHYNLLLTLIRDTVGS